MTASLISYSDMILSLPLGNYKGKTSKSKPFFLLALIECIESKKICSNRFDLSDICLRNTFAFLYEKAYEGRKCSYSTYLKPYYHLASSSFYHLIWKHGVVSPGMSESPSAKYLRENLLYAKLDDELWELLQNEDSREYLKRCIIKRYLTKEE